MLGNIKKMNTCDPWPQGIVGSLNTGHQKVCFMYCLSSKTGRQLAQASVRPERMK